MDIPHSSLTSIFGGKAKAMDNTSDSQTVSATKDTTSDSKTVSAANDSTLDSHKDSAAMKAPTDSKADAVTMDAPTDEQTDSVDSKTNAPVQHEHVKKTHEEKVQAVIDKEKHQDHYHTTVQPLKDREVAPEKHDYQEASTIERKFDDENAAETKAKLEAEKARFKNTTTEDAEESKAYESTVVGEEHVHHHHHEIIQPVIEKETVKNSVTHTKVPIHEVHHEASVVEATSVAEPKSVDEFKKEGNTVVET